MTVPVPEPWTSQAVVDTVRGLPLAGKRVALVHFGERSTPLAEAILDAATFHGSALGSARYPIFDWEGR